MPISVLISSAIPETRSDSPMISNSASSPVKMQPYRLAASPSEPLR